ncbi:signal peptidase I [Curtobacterium sp. ZW137]|uniref:signal peptidase I n=1 Tax=Curtobacterium sp. ZW137 TaxID=2485104 RepID=UPI000F938961|nr:signal peptidase I [Curtobacterium sp. ZW137]ROP64983.1 signal peptidase [Curtobacterium sp. ZW137]
MVSIEVSGPHAPRAPHDALRDAADWGRVVVATLARGVVATLLGLALWAAAPAVIGWQPTTVMTGSMEPRLVPGDVVVSRPVAPAQLRLGQVLLADDPDQPGHLRMHRYVKAGAAGTLVTKGDANPQRDSTPIERSAVHGVAFLRIPYVGTPIVWLRDGEWHKVVLLALALTAMLYLGTIDGSLRRLGSAPADGADGDDGLEAPTGSAPPVASTASTVAGPRSRRALRRRARRVRRLRRSGAVAAVVLVAGGLGVLLPAQAVAAPWTKTTVNPTTSFATATATAVTALTCTNNADNTVTIGWTYPGAAGVPTSFDVLMGTTVVGTATGSASSARVAGSGILSLGATVTVNVRTNLGGTWSATSSSTAKIKTAVIGTNLTCG